MNRDMNRDKVIADAIAENIQMVNVTRLRDAAPAMLAALINVRRELILPPHIEEIVNNAIREAEGK